MHILRGYKMEKDINARKIVLLVDDDTEKMAAWHIIN
jgi:hypothetical protein